MTARRALLRWCLAALCAALAGCGRGEGWHGVDVGGRLPALDFSLTRAGDGKAVTARDYRGKVVLVYFGYTNCPDACPTTLLDLAGVLRRLGPEAGKVRVLFVTVDPDRDSRAVLARYVRLFAPQVVGLRGTDDQIARMARRYRVAYSVTKPDGARPYEVTHSSSVYVFDGRGAARLLIPGAEVTHDLAGTAQDLRRLLARRAEG